MFNELKNNSLLEKANLAAPSYLSEIFERDVFPSDHSLEGLKYFEEKLPDGPTEADAIIEALERYGGPATVATVGGRYFGFVTGSALPIALAAKTLSTVWDQAPAMEILSPIGTKLEQIVEKWLVDLFHLPQGTVAGFVSGTSVANLCGIAAARYHLLKKQGWDINKKGLNGCPKIRIITGKQSHATVVKAITLLGFGTDLIEWVDVDSEGRIVVDNLPKLNENCLLILQAGNVNTGAFDPISDIVLQARNAGCWIHIDGAFGLWTAGVDQLKYLTDGMEHADSWAVDGHKTLNTPYDSGIILCRNAEALSNALHLSGSYIVKSESRDGMFYTPEMSRRSRIVELWACLKYLGREGIDEMVLNMHNRAKQFSVELAEINGFEVLNDVVFNQVLVQCESDVITELTMKHIQELRDCWVGGSMWEGKRAIRVSICSWATTAADISRSVFSFQKALDLTKQTIV